MSSMAEYSSSPKEWQRFYLGYRERFVDDCCILLSNGKEVRLKQAPSAKQFKQKGSQQHKQPRGKQQQQQQQQAQQLDKQSDPALTGSTVWDGAVVLSQYLCSSNSPLHELKAARETAACAAAAEAASSEASQSDMQPHNCCAGPNHNSCPAQHYPQHPCVQQLPGQHSCSASEHVPAVMHQSPSPQQQDQDSQQQQQEQQQQQQQDQGSSLLRPGLTCLELGAGTGAVSLSLLAAGVVDYALLTDIPDMLPHLQSNVEHNSRVLDETRALVLPLRWAEVADVAALQQVGQQQQQQRRWQQPPQLVAGRQRLQPPVQLQPPFDLIVGSDLIYYSYTPATPHSRLLLQALVQLAGPHSLIYLALSLHHNPEEVQAFLEWAERDWGFGVERITSGVPAEYVVSDVLVVKLTLQDTVKANKAAAAAAAGTLNRSLT